MVNVFNYIERKSFIHRMTGASKLALMLLWTLAAMVTFNTPFLIFLTVAGVILFPLSKISPKDVKVMLVLLMGFMVFNELLIFLFSPSHGCSIYGTRHELFHIAGAYSVTKEQLLYQANVGLKYTATIPIVLVFVSSTNPSELAASLNKLGLSYTVSYSVALAMRYIPDTVNEFFDISKCQQARGIEMTNKENIFRRIKSAAQLVLPLILTSIERIDIISDAMQLRKFGTGKQRTWIMGRKFRTEDYVAVVLGFALVAFSVVYNITNGGRYWNPFLK